MNNNIAFALKAGELVDVSNVERGLKCDCICAKCGTPLLARKGKIKKHHFAHYNSEECVGAFETTLHLADKSILERKKR